MRLCPICLDLGFYPIFDMDGEQRYSIDCPDCGGASVEERMTQECALVLLRSEQMPIARYLALANEHGWNVERL